MLLEKYAPRSVKELKGIGAQVADIRKFLGSWQRGRALLLYGPPGTGKTTAVRLLARELGYELAESFADDRRGIEYFRSLAAATQQRSLHGRKKLLLIDDLNIIDSTRGVAELVQNSSCPVILVADDAYEQKLAPLRRLCTLVRFSRIRHDLIAALLAAVNEKEGSPWNGQSLRQLAQSCNGDVRAALIDMETAGSYRDAEENIFQTLRVIFKTASIENARLALMRSEKPVDELLLWLEENIAEEYQSQGDVARAYAALAKADLFAARAKRRQAWGLHRYVADIGIAGIALARAQVAAGYVTYNVPRFYAQKNAAREGVLVKIGRKLHVSAKQAESYLLLVQALMSTSMQKEFGFDDDEAELIRSV